MSNTQSTDPIIYVPVPVSEPPKEDGWYDLIDPQGEAQTFYFIEGEWYETEDEARQNENHDEVNVEGLLWLKPTPLSSILKDKEDTIWALQGVIRDKDERIKELEARLKTILD